jgi:pimeloyl-ACP methyl ester carboxylesterase
MMTILMMAAGLTVFYLAFYLVLTIVAAYLVQKFPRTPVKDPPDWGRIMDTKIPAVDGGFLEVWRIDPKGTCKGVVLLVHGWGRNRDRMVSRARIFSRWGFATVIHSARDHGRSSACRFVNAVTFADDIESVLAWVGQPVVLYGHSAGSAAAVIATSRNAGMVRLLILEACYAHTGEALLSLYRWVNPFFGAVFGPMILFWMALFYRIDLDTLSPARLAPSINLPVMLVHGEIDRRFPLAFAEELLKSFKPDQARLYIAKGAGHSDSSRTKGYEAALRQFLEQSLD